VLCGVGKMSGAMNSHFNLPATKGNAVKESFVSHLEGSLTYIRGYVAAQVIFQMLENGFFDLLVKEQSTLSELSDRLGYQPSMLAAALEYLEREAIVVLNEDGRYGLTEKGAMIIAHRGWFELLIGGYGPVFGNLSEILKVGPTAVRRNGALVGRGSCNISRYDAIPLTKTLIRHVNPATKRIVDFGCGNSLYLCTFCEEMPEVTAVGVDPSAGAVEEGRKLVREKGLEARIVLVNSGALDFEVQEIPDCIMFCFVLHELYGQHGEAEVIRYLSHLGRKFPSTHLIVVEVDYDLTKKEAIYSKIGLGYYNPYFLLHPFTEQRLLPDTEWRRIFLAAGFDVVRSELADPTIDPTGLEIGYALKYRQAGGGDRTTIPDIATPSS
jgi:2-ketoarginine methyltransferase